MTKMCSRWLLFCLDQCFFSWGERGKVRLPSQPLSQDISAGNIQTHIYQKHTHRIQILHMFYIFHLIRFQQWAQLQNDYTIQGECFITLKQTNDSCRIRKPIAISNKFFITTQVTKCSLETIFCRIFRSPKDFTILPHIILKCLYTPVLFFFVFLIVAKPIQSFLCLCTVLNTFHGSTPLILLTIFWDRYKYYHPHLPIKKVRCREVHYPTRNYLTSR